MLPLAFIFLSLPPVLLSPTCAHTLTPAGRFHQRRWHRRCSSSATSSPTRTRSEAHRSEDAWPTRAPTLTAASSSCAWSPPRGWTGATLSSHVLEAPARQAIENEPTTARPPRAAVLHRSLRCSVSRLPYRPANVEDLPRERGAARAYRRPRPRTRTSRAGVPSAAEAGRQAPTPVKTHHEVATGGMFGFAVRRSM